MDSKQNASFSRGTAISELIELARTQGIETCSAASSVTLLVKSNGVAIISIDDPTSQVNSLSFRVMLELEAALAKLAGDSSVKGLVLISGKTNGFIAGANLATLQFLQGLPPPAAYETTEYGKRIFDLIAELPYTSVAAVNGAALGGGAELALACTQIVASPGSKFGFPEVGLGVIPGWDGCRRLTERVGVEAALDLILQPLKTWSDRQAWLKGLVSEMVAEENLARRAEEIALGATACTHKPSLLSRIRRAASQTSLGLYLIEKAAGARIKKETGGNMPAAPAALKTVLASRKLSAAKTRQLESYLFAQLAGGEVSYNMLRNYRLMIQQGKKKLSDSILPQKVAVLGCGFMGSGIVQLAALAGFNVYAYESEPERVVAAKASVKKLFDTAVEKGKLKAEEAEKIFDSIVFVSGELSPLAGCELFIEAIVEDLAEKQKLYKQLEKLVGAGNCVIASNTSSLSATKLASVLSDPSRFGVLHFFSPVQQMRFVELVRGQKTSQDTLDVLQSFAAKLNKVTRVFGDSPLFVVNRILAPGLYAAIRLFEEGVSPEDIDRQTRAFGLPIGALALMDEVGLDVCFKVLKQMRHFVGQERFAPTALVEAIEKQGFLGKKNGRGFYLYDKTGKRKELNPGMMALLNKPRRSMSGDEIQQRIVLAMVNEAARCLDEGVALSADDISVASILGMGWAPHRGGPLRYADSLRARSLLQRLEMMFAATGDKNYEPARIIIKHAGTGSSFCQD